MLHALTLHQFCSHLRHAVTAALFCVVVKLGNPALALTADALFDNAEGRYPHLFAPPSATQTLNGYTFRCYSATGNCLGVDPAKNVAAVGPATANELVGLGTLASFACSVRPTPVGPMQVETTQGVVQGSVQGAAISFLGIPYAAPPVGSLRFEHPVEAPCWNDVRAATAFAPVCPQIDYEQGANTGVYPPNTSEDCLVMNIWRPHATGPARAVMVFIHGGGNQQGSTSGTSLGARLLDGALLASRANAVVVTVQYRLGPLGFMAHPDLPNAVNAGLYDQIAALRWVRANARAFGGDPDRVLLFGESAGALDTCMMVASPLTTGLFSAAAMQSGGCVAKTVAAATEASASYAASVGCSGVGTADCLRNLSPQTLVSKLTPPLNGGIVGTPFGPVIDGIVLPEDPMLRIQAGRHQKVALVVGSNRDEMSAAVPPGTVTPSVVTALLRATVPEPLRTQATLLYPPGTTNADARDAYIRLLSDRQFVCPARRIARAASAWAPTFRYEFSRALPTPGLSAYGAFHGLELFYLFQSLELSLVARTLTDDDRRLAASMAAYWSSLAAKGDPNAAGQALWPVYDVAADAYLELGASTLARQGLRRTECDLWDQL